MDRAQHERAIKNYRHTVTAAVLVELLDDGTTRSNTLSRERRYDKATCTNQALSRLYFSRRNAQMYGSTLRKISVVNNRKERAGRKKQAARAKGCPACRMCGFSQTTIRGSPFASFLSSVVNSESLSPAVAPVPFGVPFSCTRFFFFFFFSPLPLPLPVLPTLVGVLSPLLVLLYDVCSACTRRPLSGCSVEGSCGCHGLACRTGVTGEYCAVELMLCGSYSSSASTVGNSRVVERLRVGRVTRGVAAGTACGSFSTGLWDDER